LYMRDIPVFYGLENTKERLKSNNEPIWALNLSGGSARAFAHIGVLKRLEEEGLRPDVIITNSIGSIVGLTYAAGMSVSDIEDMVKTLKLSEFFDITFPLKGGLIDLHRFEALMFALFGDMNLSETAIPVFVVTEDLKSKRQIILSEGNLVKVLKASFALPFYFQPVNIENFRLIDGGTTALVPINPFNDLLQIMVVSSTFYAAEVNLKNPITILNVSMDISKSRRSVKQIKEYKPFLIRCDVEEISFMAFDKSVEIITAGYDSADNVFPELINYLADRDIFPKQIKLKEFDITEELHNNWEALKTRINQTALQVHEPGWSIKPGLEAWHSFGNTHYLNQNYYPTIKTSLWYDKSLIEGMLFYSEKLTGSILRWEMGLNNFLYLNLEGMINFSTENNSFLQYSGNYVYSKAGAILPFYGVFLEPGVTAEFINVDDYN
ncbi:MAG: patatin-like phospholipase family protein, partial [Spirochaetales bacterium]|nr:patatin-like phospholipase family protein [Spirochaetales bacterium]